MTQFDPGGLCFSVAYSSFNKCVTLSGCNLQDMPVFLHVSMWERSPSTLQTVLHWPLFFVRSVAAELRWNLDLQLSEGKTIQLHELHKPVLSWRSSDQTDVKCCRRTFQWETVIRPTFFTHWANVLFVISSYLLYSRGDGASDQSLSLAVVYIYPVEPNLCDSVTVTDSILGEYMGDEKSSILLIHCHQICCQMLHSCFVRGTINLTAADTLGGPPGIC